MFEAYGDIESTYIPPNQNQQGKLYGFVSFKKPADAIKAIEHMNKKQLPSG